MNRSQAFASCWIVFGLIGCLNTASAAMDTVVIQRDGQQIELQGEVVVEAQDGGLMFRATDGWIWMIQPDEIAARRTDAKPFEGINSSALGKKIIAQLPRSSSPYRVLRSNDYTLVYNTSPGYANWVKGVYLRLNVGFRNFWKNQGVKLRDPDVPLGVVIFKSKEEFDAYSVATLGGVQGSALAYYNMQTNLVVMYDLTQTAALAGNRRSSSQQINALLRQPAAEAMVATIVHEAVHQISYNSGLQKRFAPCPFWLNEGLATFFEVPDLRSRRGWHGIGKVNNVRLIQLKKMLAGSTTEFFDAVLTGDDWFRDPNHILDAYAEAWALNFYFIKRQTKQYVAYLQELASLPPLSELDEASRLKLFEKHFGPVADVKKAVFEFVLKQ